MDRAKKHKVADELKAVFQKSEIVILCHNNGVNVSRFRALRKAIKQANGGCSVLKNSLARIAVRDSVYERVSTLLKGPTVLIHSSGDVVSVSKAVVAAFKDNAKFSLIGAAIKENSLSVKEVEYLASLPTLNELRGQLVGIMNAPAIKLMRVLKAPAEQLARLLYLHSKRVLEEMVSD
ncbi:50S ribosomal protein L10 [Alphaproteobacteria bacterium]